MKKQILKTFLILATSSILPNFVLAAPSVSSIIGNVSHDSTVIINGSEFGTKSPAEPILWETFEDGTVGNALSTTGKWVKYDTALNGGTFSSSNAYSGTKSAFNRVTGNGTYFGLQYSFNSSNFFLTQCLSCIIATTINIQRYQAVSLL